MEDKPSAKTTTVATHRIMEPQQGADDVVRTTDCAPENSPSQAPIASVSRVSTELQQKWKICDAESDANNARQTCTHVDPVEILRMQSLVEQEGLGSVTGKLKNTVLSPKFEWLAAIVIFCNAFFVGVQVQVAATRLSNVEPFSLQVAHMCFCAFYVGELLLRGWAHGFLFLSFKRTPRSEIFWNSFDLVIVSLSVFEVVMNYALPSFKRETTFLLMVRIARLIRIIRIVRNIRFFRELRMMAYSIFHTLKSLCWSFVLLFTVTYLFAIVLVQATTNFLQHVPDPSGVGQSIRLDPVAHCESSDPVLASRFVKPCDLRQYFGSLASCMDTMFESVSGGTSWGDRAALLGQVHWFAEFYFVVYVSFTLFAMLNVITGFFCEKAVDTAAQDRHSAIQEQLQNKERYIKEMEVLFKDIDVDRSGNITFSELEHAMGDERVQAYFSSLQLDISVAWDVFRLLDRDRSNVVELAEFALGCLRLRGFARTVDLATLQYEIEKVTAKLSYFMAFVESQFQILQSPGVELQG